MNDFGNRFQPNPLLMSSKILSFHREVVELQDFPYIRIKIIGQNTSVGVFSFQYFLYVVCSPLSLNDYPVNFAFPLFYSHRVQFVFYSVDYLCPSSSENEHVVIKSGTSVGTYIEIPAMRLDSIYYFLRAGAAIHACPVYKDAVISQSCKDSLSVSY